MGTNKTTPRVPREVQRKVWATLAARLRTDRDTLDILQPEWGGVDEDALFEAWDRAVDSLLRIADTRAGHVGSDQS